MIHAADADHRLAVETIVGALSGTGKAFIHTSGSSVVADDVLGEVASSTVFGEETPFVPIEVRKERVAINRYVRTAGIQMGVRTVVIALPSPQPVFAPGIDSAEVKGALHSLFLPEGKIESAINVQVINKEYRIILVDTGSGYHFGANGGWLKENLSRAGIPAAKVTDIVITHAHIDHIGGIIGKDDKLVYPNATYHIAKKGFEFWMGRNPDFAQSKSPDDPSESVLFAQTVLNAIANRLKLFGHGTTLFSCLETELAAGHTPGHTVLTVSSAGKKLKHVVDAFHTPLLVSRPEWGTQWDVDIEKGVKTRVQILEKASRNRGLLMTTHLPWPGLGYIEKRGAGFEWKPFAYSTPKSIVIKFSPGNY